MGQTKCARNIASVQTLLTYSFCITENIFNFLF